ncbi:hypothetical protein MN0502_28970 [Arthrobacter sp. MN05-02]|nr:hypothetical protein MN0502_28970 [Arthrobacter sp. MN05-02]
MISYRPTPELTAGRKGIRAAIGAMALVAVLGTTAFAPNGADAAAPVADARTAVVTGATVPAERAVVRRKDSGGSPVQGAAAAPVTA